MSPRSSRVDRERAALLGTDRLHVFVPAIMGVGLLFWLVGELRDLARAASDSSRSKQARITGEAIVDRLPGQSARPLSAEARGLRARPVYLVWAVALAIGAAYVAIGSVANYRREGGYVSDIAWLLTLATTVSLALLGLAIVAAATFVRWPDPPRWARPWLTRSLLTTMPFEPTAQAGRPSWRLSTVTVVAAGAAGLATVIVAVDPAWVGAFDRMVTDWVVGAGPPTWPILTDGALGWIGFGSLALLVPVVARRCRATTLAYLTTSVLAAAGTIALEATIDRRRTIGGLSSVESYPSRAVLFAVVVTVLLPCVVDVVTARHWAARALEVALAGVTLLVGLGEIAIGDEWPSDVIGGAAIGAAIALGGRWVIAEQRAHLDCRGCPWAPAVGPEDPGHPAHHGLHLPKGLIALGHQPARLVALVARLASAGVAIGLAVMSLTIGIPENGEGYVFGAAVERPVQLVLTGIVSIGALLARRRPAVGAVLIALAASGLGVFASVEYQPIYSVLLTAVVMIPAFLLWLGWQHDRAPHELALVAALTIGMVGGTWFGSRSVYDVYFGPTHPDSTASAVDVDRVEWVLAGALGPDTITVTTRLVDREVAARLRVVDDDDGGSTESAVVRPDGHGIAQLRVDGLRPDRSYRYAVVVDGEPDRGRGNGTFRTPSAGPMSFDVVVGSCARTGSNGAVFDAMLAEDPLLYLALGDAHYGNLAATTPGPFLDAYDRMLTEPGPAALYRSVPIAYVWDDHDYGPNDADASSPGRGAVATAYRQAIPSYDLPDDTAVYQAFTIGRVRFVMTDSRSQRTDTTMLGADQLEWLLDELVEASRTHALVVWANPVPWVSETTPAPAGWGAVPEERQRIADTIADAGITNLVMVSGDAHMVAYDDGTNTGYAANGAPGFPLLHVAALDRHGGVKGGPYSGGTYPGGGQYGRLRVEDDGSTLVLTMSGYRWDGTRLVEERFEVPAAGR